jgi:hypothetical protein
MDWSGTGSATNEKVIAWNGMPAVRTFLKGHWPAVVGRPLLYHQGVDTVELAPRRVQVPASSAKL